MKMRFLVNDENCTARFEAVRGEAFGFPRSGDAMPDLRSVIVPASPPSRFTLPWLILMLSRLYSRSPVHRWKHRNGCPCLFIPTCKEYLERAVVQYGPWRGLKLAWRRLRRCNGRYQGPYVDFP